MTVAATHPTVHALLLMYRIRCTPRIGFNAVMDSRTLTAMLAAGGFLAPDEEAQELTAAAGGDAAVLEAMVRRRLTGEPLAWITGTVEFCGLQIRIDPEVFVPRWHTEPLVRLAAERLPATGTGIDVCTGSGAVARVLASHRPDARVVGTDLDPAAVDCARSNGVEAYAGDLFAPVPPELRGAADVVIGAVPFVPTDELWLLQRDTFTFESPLAYDGGRDGCDILRRAVAESTAFLRVGGTLFLALGGRQDELLRPDLERAGFTGVHVHADEEGDVRGIEATLGSPP
jgi:release factor glutamine methyltransferase